MIRPSLTRLVLLGACTLLGLQGLASADAISVSPCDVPDEKLPRVGLDDAPAGFGPDSWQGPLSRKSNWHARYLADGDYLSQMFPADAATMTLGDLASISYWTKRDASIPANRDWWLQIYTRPTGMGDAASWYHHRFISNYNEHGAGTGAWEQTSTDGAMTFNRNDGAAGALSGVELTLADLIATYGDQEVMMFSLQTDSGWNGFDGFVDGLEIALLNGNTGVADLTGYPDQTTLDVVPQDVPDEEFPRVILGDTPPGFESDSWQGPSTGKSNWHARYLQNGDALTALFPAEAATLTIGDLKALSYWTKRDGSIPATRDWWVQIYTRPTGVGDARSWYHHRFISNYNEHGAGTGQWVQHSTEAAMTFNRNDSLAGGLAGVELSLNDLIAEYGDQLIEMISVQTDSGWGGFDGQVDGLEVLLDDCRLGRVNFEAVLSQAIDLRPNNAHNQVNTGSRQLVPVAILGSATFDPCDGLTGIDPDVTARGASASTTRTRCEDVNGDGFTDMVVYFRARDLDPPTAAECDDPDAKFEVSGTTLYGAPFAGSDSVTWLNCP